jgi:hypothetical protein
MDLAIEEFASLDPTAREVVIVGASAAGKAFRPSDWAERLCGMMSIFGEEQKLSYSPYLKPVLSENVKCVVVDLALRGIDPAAFRFLMDFVHDNELTLRSGRVEPRPDEGDLTARAA